MLHVNKVQHVTSTVRDNRDVIIDVVKGVGYTTDSSLGTGWVTHSTVALPRYTVLLKNVL